MASFEMALAQRSEPCSRRRRQGHRGHWRLYHGARDVDDASEASLLHSGQQAAEHPGRSEQIRFECGEPLFVVPVLEAAGWRTGVVVDEDVCVGTRRDEPVVEMFRSNGQAVWAHVDPLTRGG
jgi:hypothetical protein